MLELDHVFVMAAPGAPAIAQLAAAGFLEGRSNRHAGQGTQNRCVFFRNAYLELLWVCDADEARAPLIAPTRLWERAQFRATGVAPFGVCVRPAAALPFATWPYRPPYMPAAAHIDVADTAPHEPLVFATPWGTRPDALPPDRRQPLEHSPGVAELTAVRITRPRGTALSAAPRALAAAGLVSFADGDDHLAELELDGATRGFVLDLRPALPLVLRA